MSENVPQNALTPKIALRIQIGDDPHGTVIQHPVADKAEGERIMALIRKTPGFLILGDDTPYPVMFKCGRVTVVSFVDAAPVAPMPPPVKLAKLNQ